MAITGAIAIVPIMASVSAATDWSAFSRQKSVVQQALDSAALAAAKQLMVTTDETQLSEYARDFFEVNLGDVVNIDDVNFSFNLSEGDSSVEPPIPTTVDLGAQFTYDTMFGPVIGVEEITTNIISEISVGNRSVEIALVMDNSGSMGSNGRINTMKSTTLDLVSTIFQAGSVSDIPDPVKFSVVPFSAMVNVGTNNVDKNWMDKKGWSSIHHENFDWNTYQTTKNTRFKHTGFQVVKDGGGWDWQSRIDVYNMMGESWGGCVEMRPWPYNTTDDYVLTNQGFNTVKNTHDADGDGTNDGNDALFVYNFAPDEPDRNYVKNEYGSYRSKTDDDSYSNDYIYDFETKNGNRFAVNDAPSDSDFVGAFDPDQYWSTNHVNRKGC